MIVNVSFYKRLLIAMLFNEVENFYTGKKSNSVFETFHLIELPKDRDLEVWSWFSLGGNNLDKTDDLLDICLHNLEVCVAQPRYNPFTVSNETLESDKTYMDWFANDWLDYLTNILNEFESLCVQRIAPGVTRGKFDYFTKSREWIANHKALNSSSLKMSKSF